MITLQAAMQKGFALTDGEVDRMMRVLKRNFPDAAASPAAHAFSPGNLPDAIRPLLGARRPVVWPDYSDPKIRSSMFRLPQPMSAETKEKLRALTPQRDVNDEIAVQLRGLSLPEVYTLGAGYLKEKEQKLRSKYVHLNPGQQRMVIGNRMRAKYRKEHVK